MSFRPQSISLETRNKRYLNAVANEVSENWVLLLHDLGERYDLDSWNALPGALHAAGFSSLQPDLPGHGLSEGPSSRENCLEGVKSSLGWIATRGARRAFLVTAGKSAFLVTNNEKIDAAVFVSPIADSNLSLKLPRVPKLFLVGSLNKSAQQATEAMFRTSSGWSVTSSFGIHEQGHELLESAWNNQATNQIVAFLRDYADSS